MPVAARPPEGFASPAVIPLADLDGEPRVRDLDLAERLGFGRVRDVRKLIDRNRAEIERMGTCATVAHVVRGNPVAESWLNEEQALLVATLSNTPRAAEVRSLLIKTFVAWRRGHLAGAIDPKVLGGVVRAVVAKQLDERLPEVRAQLVTTFRRRSQLSRAPLRGTQHERSSCPNRSPRPEALWDEDAADLQGECLGQLAEAITNTATNWLCTRPDRHHEREHLVGLLTDLICEGRLNAKVVRAAVAASERVFDPDEYQLALDLKETVDVLTPRRSPA